MNRVRVARFACLIAVGLGTAFAAAAQVPYTGHGNHVMVAPEALQWRDAPSVGRGAPIALIEGPFDKAVPFTFRLRLPAGLKIAPHTHPGYERVTVLSGTLHFAHGTSFDRGKTIALKPGAVAIMPPGEPMFGYTEAETVIQLHGVGPWGLRYINPADDPRKG